MRDSTPRKKLSPSPLLSASEARPPLAAAANGPRPVYASIFAHARAAGLFAICTIAPLGALAGTVSACGAAAPVRATPSMMANPNAHVAPPTGAGTQPAPLTSIAPPGTVPPPAPE